MSEQQQGSRPADLVLVTAAIAAVGFVASMLPLRSWDYWYHLTIGRLLAVRNALPSTNIFGFSGNSTEPVFVHTWLGDLGLFQLHAASGLVGALAARNLCAIAAFAAVAWATYQISKHHAVATASLTLGAGLVFLAVSGFAGPQMFAWPIFGGLAVLSVLAMRGGRWLWVLPVAFGLAAAVWANTAPNFWVPGLTAAAFAAAARWQQVPRGAAWFGASALLAVLGPLANPHGPGIVEGLLDWRGMEAWLILAGPLALGAPIAGMLPDWGAATSRLTARVASGMLMVCALALQPWSDFHRAIPATVFGDAVRQTDPLRGYGPAGTPVEAVEVMRSWGSQPRVYAEPHLSGYLLYELQDPIAPLPIVWPLPDRGPSAQVAQLTTALENEPGVFRGVFQQYAVDAVLITPGLAQLGVWMQAAPDWQRVGEWPSGTLYVPRSRSKAAAE